MSLGEHHFQGLTNPDVNLNRMHQLFCYMTIFSCLAAVTKVMLTGLDLSQAICYMTIFSCLTAVTNVMLTGP